MSDIRNWKKIVENATKVVENDAEDVNHTDHEVSMAKSQLLSSVKSSVRIAKHLKDLSEDKGLEGWVASKITLAEEYLQTVADYMDGQEINESVVSEAGGYYTQPVYDMIKKHGIQKVMHELLTSLDADVIQDFISRAEFTESEKRWKQTSMSPEQAEKEYGKENVKVKRGGLRNGDDMVQVFVEGYKVLPPMDKEKYQARDGLEGPFSTLSGKVVYYDPKEGKYYDPDTDMYISYEDFQKLDNDYSDMKEEQIDEGYEGAIIHALQKHDINGFFNKGTLYIEDGADMSTVEEIVNQTVEIAPEIKPEDDYYQMEGIEQSEALTEDQFDEAAGEKDACYHKVKSRYKVWPSAYASGALVKCRKVGASNWGNSKK